MIIRSLLRRPSAIRAFATPPIRLSVPHLRSIHHRPPLKDQLELVENGIPGLLTKEAFNEAWMEYQQYMMDELNACSAGMPWEHNNIQSVVIDTARNPMLATPFNYASMAWNNHFFFKGIATDPTLTSTPSPNLAHHISTNFSSMTSFADTFLGTAEAMFGPGFVWLVQTNDAQSSLRILTTYLSGSPLSGAHYRRQATDLSTHNADTYQSQVAVNDVGAFGPHSAAAKSKAPKKPLGGVDVVPLLCVNTWEHVWLRDFGVKGKREFLERWWSKIDWSVVEAAAKLPQPKNAGGGRRDFVY